MQATIIFKRSLLIALLMISAGFINAQRAYQQDSYKRQGKENHISKSIQAQTPLLNNYDVKFYFLDIAAERTSIDISGNVTIKAEVVSSVLDTFAFELIDSLTVDSVLINGVHRTFTRSNDEVFVKVTPAISHGTLFTAKIFYGGTPPSGGFFSGISNAFSQSWGNQITWTLSESFNAKQWLPCKQVLGDKADSSYVFITTSDSNKAGSNGLLTNIVSLPNHKVRYEWKERYPIDYYLISIAVGKYIDYSIYAHPANLPNDSILIQNYVYDNPSTLPYFKTQIDLTADFIELYSNLYGLYPFWKEKYGHCMAPLSGGMEHETMTTLGFFDFTLTSHELSHQWFGDNVTCATWSDIWLNEGFASYSEYLALEYLSSGQEKQWMIDNHNSVLSQTDGSVYIPALQATDENRIFDSRLSYDKGAAIIHMLRFELQNDTTFFNIMKAYQFQYKDSVATGEDFKHVAETLSGKNFTNYFNQWYYGEGYPIFNVVWTQLNDTLFISNAEATSTTITPLFKMLIPFKIHTTNGDTLILLQQNQNNENFKIPLSKNVTGIVLDPDNWLVKVVNNIIQSTNELVKDENSFLVYPNPATDIVNIQFSKAGNHKVQVFDLDGRLVLDIQSNNSLITIGTQGMNKGIYTVKVLWKNELLQTKRIVKL